MEKREENNEPEFYFNKAIKILKIYKKKDEGPGR